MCLVSFIVPVYNRTEEEVSTCISSIVHQTVSNFELIIIDDGSNNGIEFFCDDLARKYDATVIHQKNQGLAVARNTGMLSSRGEWIVHVDGDDWVDLELVEAISSISNDMWADIIVWGYVIDNGKRRQKLLLKNKTAFDSDFKLIKESVLCSVLGYDLSFSALALNTSWGKAYRRSFVNNNHIFYDSSLRRAQDAVYNLYAFNKASSVKYIDKALNYYRTSNVSLSRGYNPKTFEYLQQTAQAVSQFVSKENVSQNVKDASLIFIQRCFRIITEQYYQHKNNPQSYNERKALFLSGIEKDPFNSAFSSELTRSGIVNRVTDFFYKHRMFGNIFLWNSLIRLVRGFKDIIGSQR